MKAYLAVSGTLFLLVVIAHAARVAVEGTGLLHDAGWLALTGLAMAMAGWALLLLRRSGRD